jgi:AmmeMemoRadiSam system protein A
VAREAIEAFVTSHRVVSSTPLLPAPLLQERSGVFVSIHEYGELRGCIGTTEPTQANVAEEIIANAIAASSEDPRFTPIEAWELPYLDLSVDVLSPSEKIPDKSQLDVKKYGVIVEHGNHRGLLLPNLEGVDSVDQQIAIAKRKAGLDEDANVTLYRFEVVRHQ